MLRLWRGLKILSISPREFPRVETTKAEMMVRKKSPSEPRFCGYQCMYVLLAKSAELLYSVNEHIA